MQLGFERRRGFSLQRQLVSLAPLGVLWATGLTLLIVARVQTATPLRDLLLDPSYVDGRPWYTGALSNLGILVWTAGVVFAGAGAWVARRIGRDQAATFLTVGAGATMVLVLDDVYRIHSGPLRGMLGSKTVAQFLIVLPVLVWLVKFLPDIQRTRSALLLAALGSLGGSVVVDFGIGLRGDTGLLIEDGMKFLGILAWSQYFAITSRDIAASAIESAQHESESGTDSAESIESIEEANNRLRLQRRGAEPPEIAA